LHNVAQSLNAALRRIGYILIAVDRMRVDTKSERTSGVISIMIRSLTCFGVAALLIYSASTHARQKGPPRDRPIDMVVIHSTGGPTCDAKTGKPIWVAAGSLADNMANINAHPQLGIHYMIDRDGTVRKSVPEDQIAHHVIGYSQRSIAIELINDGDGVDPFASDQLAALVVLLKDIRQRRSIARAGVVRHSDLDKAMMPCDSTRKRKVDPGALYPHQLILDQVFTGGNK
jgi:N-acetylmuramoyl-L-alanine amidase